MLEFYFEDIDAIELDSDKLSIWIKNTINNEQLEIGDISYIFCSDDYILNVNKEYLSHDYYTDIITFNYNEEKIISGDLFISLDTVKSNAELFKTDFNQELHRVIIHGILHLIGFDDVNEELQEEMTRQENKALHALHELA